MKKLLSLMLTFMLCLSVVNITASAEREYAADVSVLGTVVDFENQPFAAYSTIFVPLEELCGYINFEITQDGGTYSVKRGNTVVKLSADNLICTINGVEAELPHQPVMRDGVLFVSVEVFSVGFNCPTEISADMRSADIAPNVYAIKVDEQSAAGVKAERPDEDTLVLTTSGADTLYWNPVNFPNKVSAVYYKADMSEFAGKDIENVTLSIYGDRSSNYNPTITATRTAPWEKGQLTYNTMPEEYDDIASVGTNSARGFFLKELNVTNMAKNALAGGNTLYIKLSGNPHSSKLTTDAVPWSVKGVNTPEAPCFKVTVNESYSFPVKSAAAADTDTMKYSELELLYSLGVFTENDEFPLDMGEGVQRQEFVEYALRLRGGDIPAGNPAQFFSDVPQDAPFFTNVASAHSLGLVLGGTDSTFRPYDNITVGEAITILGRMLGYNIYADERGGFTPGYFAAARQGDLYLGTSSETQELSFAKMIDLFENALDAKMLDVVSYSSDGKAEYIFNEDMTILTEFWNAKVIEGVVTANEYSSITPGVDGSEGYITIGTTKLTLNYEPYNELLGYRVKGWYNEETDTLLYIGSKETSVTEVSFSDIEGTSDSASAVSFNYIKENGNRASESFSKDAVVIYNGKSVSRDNVSSALLSADSGSVKIVGSDLVIITAYSTILVYSTDSEEEIIYDTYEQYDKMLRLSGKDYSFKETSGREIPLTELKNGDVLSVAVSIDGELIEGIVSTTKVVGAITLLENGGTADEIITVSGMEYETANRNEQWTQYVRLGANGTFYIDAFGNIIGFKAAQTEEILGYLITVDNSGKSSLRDSLQAAVVIKGFEEYQVYDLADKVTIDGEKMDDADDIKAYFCETDEETGESIFKTQGIIFDLDGEGRIREIDTGKLGDSEDIENSLHEWTPGMARYHGESINEQFFLYLTEALGVMQYEPENPALDDFEPITSLAGNRDQNFTQIYTIGTQHPEVKIAKLDGEEGSATVGGNETPVIVDRIVTAYDSEGYEVCKLYYYGGTQISSVIVPMEDTALLTKKYYKNTNSDGSEDIGTTTNPTNTMTLLSEMGEKQIERGDVVRFAVNTKGEMSAIEVLYEYSSKTINPFFNDLAVSSKTEDRTMGGYTTMVKDNYVRVSKVADNSTDVLYKWFNIDKFPTFLKYTVSSAGLDVSTATATDIRTYEKVPYSPTGIVMENVYTSIRGSVILVDMARPAGEGLFAITVNKGENVTGEPSVTSIRADIGDTITIPGIGTMLKSEYRFIGWTVNGQNNPDDGELYQAGDTYEVISENTTIDAVWEWEGRQYFITFAGGDGATGTEFKMTTSDRNPALTIPAVTKSADTYHFTKSGYTYRNWTDGTNIYQPGATVDMAMEKTIYPNWIKVWDGSTSTTPQIEDGVYQISNGDELAGFSALVNAGQNDLDAVLTNDIDLGGKNWKGKGIGSGGYAGEFDGKNFTVYNFYTSSNNSTQEAFFYTINGGTVKNINFEDAVIAIGRQGGSSAPDAAVVCATFTSGTISNITTSGRAYIATASSPRHGKFGSIVNRMSGGTIENCRSDMEIDLSASGRENDKAFSDSDINYTQGGIGDGGIVGSAYAGTIRGCSFSGTLNAPHYRRVGGIIGDARSAVVIENCTNSGNVTGFGQVAGIVGWGGGMTLGAGNTNSGTITATATENPYAAEIANGITE